MPARLACAHHFRRTAAAAAAACDPVLLATTRSLSIAAVTRRTQSQSQPQPHQHPRARIQSHPNPPAANHQTQTRLSSSSSSNRWKTRQTSDPYTKSSKLTALKSRAAYKLLEINEKHKLFRPGQSVVDLGYAPGSWSQVAKNRVGETGRVVGIDVIPAQPPRGVSALQGDFLSEGVQGRVREFVREWKMRDAGAEVEVEEGEEGDGEVRSVVDKARGNLNAGVAEEEEAEAKEEDEGYVSAQSVEEGETVAAPVVESATKAKTTTPKKEKKKKLSAAALDLQKGRVVDVVLSDMCAPFPGLELSSWINSVNRPYRRMMNTSGNPFRDHAGSIDLCMAALTFCHDCLMTGGHFLCKFYQGPEDKDLENRMKKLFEKVHRIKPDSSRKESRESYFVGLRRKADVSKEDVFG